MGVQGIYSTLPDTYQGVPYRDSRPVRCENPDVRLNLSRSRHYNRQSTRNGRKYVGRHLAKERSFYSEADLWQGLCWACWSGLLSMIWTDEIGSAKARSSQAGQASIRY